MISKQEIKLRRQQLQSKEKKIMADLETETTELESSLQSSLKKLAIVGGGILAAVLIYKLFDTSNSEVESKKSAKKKNRKSSDAPSPITASVISLAVQKLLPLAIQKITSFNKKDKKNEQAAESTSR